MKWRDFLALIRKGKTFYRSQYMYDQWKRQMYDLIKTGKWVSLDTANADWRKPTVLAV